MKICFLSYTHPYNDTRVLHKEAYSLGQAGFEVTHLAPSDTISNQKINGVNIEIYPRGTGLVSRITRFLRLYRKGVEINADCYHCNEIESWLIGLLIKLFHRKKRVIFDVHEHFPSRFDEPHIPSYLGTIGKPVLRLMYQLLPYWTDHLIFAKRSVAPDFPTTSTSKQTFIFNYGPLRFQSRQPKDVPLAIQELFKGRKTAIHIGGFSKARGWPQLLQALSLVENKELQVLCFGSVHEGEETLMNEAKKLGVAERIVIKQPVPYEQLFDYLLWADIGIMLYQPNIQNHIFAFPMKMYDYMLAGLPFIGPNFAIEVTPVVQECGCGWLIDTSDPNEISRSLDWFCNHPVKTKAMGEKGRQAIIDKYNWESEAKKLTKIYRGLLCQESCIEDKK